MVDGYSGGYAPGDRRFVGFGGAGVAALTVFWLGVCFLQSRGNRIKVLLWDGTGVWLCQRRLHQGRFVWGRSDTGGMALTSSQWAWLIAGVDWRRLELQSCAQRYS